MGREGDCEVGGTAVVLSEKGGTSTFFSLGFIFSATADITTPLDQVC